MFKFLLSPFRFLFSFFNLEKRDYTRDNIEYGRFIHTHNSRILPHILVLHGAQSGGKTYLGTELITKLISQGVPKIFTFGFNYFYKEKKRNTFLNRFLHFLGYMPYLSDNNYDVVERLDVENENTKGLSVSELENYCMRVISTVGNCAVVFDEPAGMTPDKRLMYQDKLQQLLKRGVMVVIIVPYPTCIHKRIRVSVSYFVECTAFRLFTQVLWFKRIHRTISQSSFDEDLDNENVTTKRRFFNPFIGKRYDTTELVKSYKKDINFYKPQNKVLSFKHIHFFYKGNFVFRAIYFCWVAFLWVIKISVLFGFLYLCFSYYLQTRYSGPDCSYTDRGNGFYINVCDDVKNPFKHRFFTKYGVNFTIIDYIRERI